MAESPSLTGPASGSPGIQVLEINLTDLTAEGLDNPLSTALVGLVASLIRLTGDRPQSFGLSVALGAMRGQLRQGLSEHAVPPLPLAAAAVDALIELLDAVETDLADEASSS